MTNSAIQRLIAGYKQFKQKHYEHSDTFDILVEKGQKPKVLIIACCDSRVDPAILTQSDPGQLFVIRNIANLVPPYHKSCFHAGTSTALEYGVLALGVTDIIVLGHSHCGGINTLLNMTAEQRGSFDFIDTWLDIIKPVKEKILMHYSTASIEEQTKQLEEESLLMSLQNLKTFSWIKERVLQKKLSLHAWYFNLATGDIETYDAKIDRFIPLV